MSQTIKVRFYRVTRRNGFDTWVEYYPAQSKQHLESYLSHAHIASDIQHIGFQRAKILFSGYNTYSFEFTIDGRTINFNEWDDGFAYLDGYYRATIDTTELPDDLF